MSNESKYGADSHNSSDSHHDSSNHHSSADSHNSSDSHHDSSSHHRSNDSHYSSDSHRSGRHHHHHHHSGHRYDGPRSRKAENLPDEYNVTLSDEISVEKPEDEIVDLVFDEDYLSEDEISLDILQQKEENTRRHTSDESNTQTTGNNNNHHSSAHSSERSSGHDNGRSSRKKHRRKHGDSWSRKKRKSRILINILLGIVGLLILVILAFFLLRYMGERQLENNVVEKPVEVTPPEEVETEDDENLVIYNGERYWYNEDIITVLCLGVDRQAFVSPDEMVIGGNGQADADVLMVIDKKTGKISLLNISRDCIAEIDRYNSDGQFIDTKKEQLCLSFAFGDGEKTSCENTSLSVSRLLYGMPINAYVAIDFESVGILNDSVGGVTVPITEDIAEQFPGLEVGSNVNLVGSEAVTYIRTRDTKQLDSNNVRMSRQKQYLLAFIKKAIEQLKADPTKAVSLYKAISDNMVTSVKLSEATYFGSLFVKYGFGEQNLYSLKGEVVEDDEGFALFMPDEKALYETVLELFYIKE